MRGYGDGARLASGGYYHFVDYVFDLADLVEQLVPTGSPLYVVGHSMGGSIANRFAGTFPERVTRLALLEGAGPPRQTDTTSPPIACAGRSRTCAPSARARRAAWPHGRTRSGAWSATTHASRRTSSGVASRRCPARSRKGASPGRPIHCMEPAGRCRSSPRAGRRLHAGSPVPSSSSPADRSAGTPQDEEARVSAFATLKRAEIPDAGHMMHWTEPAKLTRLLLEFFGGDVIPGALSP